MTAGSANERQRPVGQVQKVRSGGTSLTIFRPKWNVTINSIGYDSVSNSQITLNTAWGSLHSRDASY